ncbi:PR domain zinc finger protein 10-like [Haliotis cracherodii]|uniref:PR domain zinc finger protein 10-like n=1 Tax=Haliotis cracherodii TaxID=6455 RepID=UPI0039EA15DE
MEDPPSPASNHNWEQPDQSQFVTASSSSMNPASPEPQQPQQYDTNNAQPMQAYNQAAEFEETHYHSMRPAATFSGEYSGSQSDVYQAAHSTYERISPVDDYREVAAAAGSDGISSYSTIQPAETAQVIRMSAVDSSSLQQQGYQVHQVVLDQDHRVVAVQRVISPADCTVSQSSLSLRQDGSEAQPNTALLPVQPQPSGAPSYVTVHVTSMPQFASHGEVSTSGDSPLMSQSATLEDRDTHRADGRDLDSLSGEPDTTQEDVHDYSNAHASRGYLHPSTSYTSTTSAMDSEALHSTMPGPSSLTTSSSHVVMDATMDSSHLASSSSHEVAMSTSLDTSLHTPGDVIVMEAGMDRSVGSSAIGPDLAQAVADSMVTGSDAALGQVYSRVMDDDKENDPQSSHGRVSASVRKSTRIATLDQEQASTSWRRRRHTYVPKPYNSDELWCEECMTTYPTECPVHRLSIVLDKVVLSRAWSSLPPQLQIYRLSETGGAELGVFAKKPIPKYTQFGPFVGDLVDSQEKVTVHKFPLMLDRSDSTLAYFETSDENKCNWMMFVRPAENFMEQNLVAYQHGQDIFFTVAKPIDTRQELKVWYAAHYATRMGLKTHDMTQEDRDALDEQEYRFPCYECNKRFKTSVALQRHLLGHEEGTANQGDDDEFDEKVEVRSKAKKRLFTKGLFKARARAGKKDGLGETSGYQWKKKSTSIYLNKTLKKYQRRPHTEKIRQTIKSLYKKKGKDTGGNEWVCMHCDLTFDNSNLLNLHTLTHAAEDVGLDEIKKFACDVGEMQNANSDSDMRTEDGEIVSMETYLACPMCHRQFANKRDLIDHASEHGKSKKKLLNPNRPHKCEKCWKAFGSQDRLQKHMLCHGEEDSKPLQCDVCYKRFMNNSALACHMKTHSDKKYYECPICRLGFDQITTMKNHIVLHAQSGYFTCPECGKQFDDYHIIRKHMKAFHSEKRYPCPECDKVFPRQDKLKLHMLRHSTHREFMCENCGRQFKRKDKLKEHIKRMHSLEREVKNAHKGDRSPSKKFIPKVSPTDYHRFIYKCHTCLLGFKRRGMLVNHLAKRHPEIKPDQVPELNLPILKTQRDYYCQYCDKVYKSSSKRKAHIIKNHPGADLPISSRKKCLIPEIPGLPNPTYSQTVGSITTMPHSCQFCHKQYASKAKLMQHQRKKHPDFVPQLPERPKMKDELPLLEPAQQPERYEEVTATVQGAQPETLQAADLLTQAMSELTQTLQEYRPGEFHITSRLPTMVITPAQHPSQQHTTIELSHLGHALAHTQFAQVATSGATVIAAAPPPAGQQAIVAGHPVSVSVVTTNPGQTQTIQVPVSTWANYQTYR